MSAELDMSQYLDLFLQEAEEQLEVLESETLKLEEDPTHERMSAIFRAAHTLKGSSRAMGYATFAGITHEMEDLLDLLRGGEVQVSTKIADTLLRCIDKLRELKARISNGEGDAIDASALLEELKALKTTSGEKASAATAPGTQAAPEVAPQDAPRLPAYVEKALQECTGSAQVYHATFRLRPDCVMKYVRAFMAITVVQDGGELLATLPEPANLEEERFDLVFELYFQHRESVATLKSRFDGIGEVASFDVDVYKEAATPVVDAADPSAKAPQPADVAGAPSQKRQESNQTVRVDVARLDELMNLVGELVIDRTRVAQIGSALAARYTQDESIEALSETVGHITRITSDLQDQLMKARMLPIETVFNRFPRMVRDLSQKIGKEVKLDLIGGETELDRSVIEVIGDPIIHILRNSVDHGVETPDEREKAGKPRSGQIRLSARHEENHIVIEIEDDGRGIDVERVRKKAVQSGLLTADAAERLSERETLNLIFASGLSTAATVTEVSGRGVGMDIVKSNIQKLGGLVEIETVLGKGTRTTMRLPLTLAIIRGLLVKVSGVVYVLPLGSVVETLLVPKAQIQTVSRREVIVIRGVTTPLVRLQKVFANRNFTGETELDPVYVVIVGLAEQRVGLVVDSLVGEQEVVIKSLNRFCGEVRGISGATILGNGNVALIVDVNGVLSMGK